MAPPTRKHALNKDRVKLGIEKQTQRKSPGTRTSSRQGPKVRRHDASMQPHYGKYGLAQEAMIMEALRLDSARMEASRKTAAAAAAAAATEPSQEVQAKTKEEEVRMGGSSPPAAAAVTPTAVSAAIVSAVAPSIAPHCATTSQPAVLQVEAGGAASKRAAAPSDVKCRKRSKRHDEGNSPVTVMGHPDRLDWEEDGVEVVEVEEDGVEVVEEVVVEEVEVDEVEVEAG